MVRFSDLILGPQDNGFIQERGVVAGTSDQGWRGHCDSCFSCGFGCCISCCLGPFSGRYLGSSSVPGQGLGSCVVVWFSFLVAVLVGAFVALLVAVLVFAFGALAPGLVLAWSFQFLLVTILVVIFCL